MIPNINKLFSPQIYSLTGRSDIRSEEFDKVFKIYWL